jgi:hypothetical protein
MNSRGRVNSTVGPLGSRTPMKRIIYSIIGGTFIMFAFGIGFLFGARQFFKWAMAWPALFLYRFFPPPSPDQIFPKLGGTAGILCTFAVATLAYSLLIYVVLSLLSKTSRSA